jgi:hypothetical protein
MVDPDDELVDAGEGAAVDHPIRERDEEPLAWPPCQPPLHTWMFVRTVVVPDEVDIQALADELRSGAGVPDVDEV